MTGAIFNSQQANGLAALLVGAYLAAVTLRVGGQQRTMKLLTLLKQEAGFFKWGAASIAVGWLASRKEIGDLGAGLIMLVFTAAAMKVASDPTILNSIKKVWRALPSGSPGTLTATK